MAPGERGRQRETLHPPPLQKTAAPVHSPVSWLASLFSLRPCQNVGKIAAGQGSLLVRFQDARLEEAQLGLRLKRREETTKITEVECRQKLFGI